MKAASHCQSVAAVFQETEVLSLLFTASRLIGVGVLLNLTVLPEWGRVHKPVEDYHPHPPPLLIIREEGKTGLWAELEARRRVTFGVGRLHGYGRSIANETDSPQQISAFISPRDLLLSLFLFSLCLPP